jgi:hypothetical protein
MSFHRIPVAPLKVFTLACGFFLQLLLMANPSIPAGPIRVKIDYAVDVESGERDPIQAIGKGKRLILFGEEPATYRFVGRTEGRLSSSVGYYWTFPGGVPERVPAGGISDKPDSGPIRFSGAGTAQLHLVAESTRKLTWRKTSSGCVMPISKSLVKSLVKIA